jgi:hypothetical protein
VCKAVQNILCFDMLLIMLKVYAEKHVDLHAVRFEPILGRVDMLYLNFPV